ncbi:MAG: hypothetical protein R2771_02690 [Saprospiraceae bacterium]
MKSIIVLISFFLLGILFSGCEKDPYADAKENHRFFRCKVNGKEWHNESYDWFYGDDSAMEYYLAPDSIESSGRFIIKMNYYPNENTLESLVVHIDRNLKVGENRISKYLKNEITNDSFAKSTFNIFKPEYKFYYPDETYKNQVNIIDIDSTNRIIKGTFEFRAITEDGRDTVLVTDGEFDWKPNWYIY